VTRCLVLLFAVLLTGCVSTETRSEGRRVLERTETPTSDGGKITRETERTETGTETVTKADLSAALQAAVAGMRGDLPGLVAAVLPKPPSVNEFLSAVPKVEQPKLLGFTMPEIAAGAGALWSLERGAAIYHKRRRAKVEHKP